MLISRVCFSVRARAARYGTLSLLAVSLPAFVSFSAFASEVTIGAPANGARVLSPVLVRAFNTGCNGLAPTSFGYSVDDAGAIMPGESARDIDITRLALPEGTHTIHFRSSTSEGQCPEVTSTFTVAHSGDTDAQPAIPANAVSSGDLDPSGKWTQEHDGGTPGESRGSTEYPAKVPEYSDGRKFYMTYSDQAGERWSNTFTHDPNSTHFVLDTYVYLPNPSQLKNLELDINQVISSGETIILSTQCSGEIGAWEYGDTVGRHDHWKSTNIKCDPANWAANVWHHVQIGEHRDTNGYVTHDWVTVDGAYRPFEDATLESAHFLDWGPGDLNTQFQIEGSSSGKGSATAYIHKFTVYRW